jgi:uncharacterized protein YgbK (DUF1537 family)
MALALFIIADDLTGAADTAVQFSKQGIRAAVFPSANVDFRGLGKAVEVVAVTTGSRHLPRREAYARVRATAEEAHRRGCRRFYKKIDSTFRGNVGAELEALMAGAGAPRLMLAPAYPAAGRIVRNGYLYVNGTPLHESAFARDPREPAAESFIPAIIGRQTSLTVSMVGSISAAAAMDFGSGIFLFDAATGRDLGAIGRFLDKKGALDAVAGSAGFAEALAGLYYAENKSSAFRGMKGFSHTRRPLFVVNGSLNDVSLGQVEQAGREGTACFLLSPDKKSEHLTELIVRNLKRNGCAVLTTAASVTADRSPSAYAEKIARIAAAVIDSLPDSATAVFGGDTAFAVCRNLHCSTLFPCGEIMPGLTVCAAGTPSGRRIVLKSGGFGSRDVIRRIREYFKRIS